MVSFPQPGLVVGFTPLSNRYTGGFKAVFEQLLYVDFVSTCSGVFSGCILGAFGVHK